jgi:photosystem II stability/assembly factor-like uncharacterized protein
MHSRVNTLASSGWTVFAGTDSGGVFLTTNSGANWTAVNNGIDTTVRSLAIGPASGGSGINLFAGTEDGVLVSTNSGTTWAGVNTGLSFTDVRTLAL